MRHPHKAKSIATGNPRDVDHTHWILITETSPFLVPPTYAFIVIICARICDMHNYYKQ